MPVRPSSQGSRPSTDVYRDYCKHRRCEGIRVLCDLGHDPSGLAAPPEDPTEPRKGIAFRYPCCRAYGHSDRCPDATFPTEEEAQAAEQQSKRSTQNTLAIVRTISERHPGRGQAEGTMPCPSCGSGIISYRRMPSPFRGGVSLQAACSTDGCIRFRGH